LITFCPVLIKNIFNSGIGEFGGAMVATALNRSWAGLLILLVLAGSALTISSVNANTFLQESARNSERAKIARLFQLSVHGGLSIGALITGISVDKFGVSKALGLNGALAIICQLLILWGSSQRRPTQSGGRHAV